MVVLGGERASGPEVGLSRGTSVLDCRVEGSTMLQTVEAMIDEAGNVRLLEPLHLSSAHRALVTILDAAHPMASMDPALLSEPALATDWNRPEEDEAWSHLQRVS